MDIENHNIMTIKMKINNNKNGIQIKDKKSQVEYKM